MNAPQDTPLTDEITGSVAEKQPVRRVLVFTTVALALMMMSVDSTIVATALHALQHGLDTSINWAGWTLTAYSFGFVLMLPISGRLSERYGRRQVFIGSAAVFTVASLCCGLADNIYALIALRAVQAAGGAGFTPSATGIVVDHFGDARDRAVSLFGSIFPIGAMIGPIFGGLFVAYWSWRGVFFINVPIGVAVILLALRYIPHDRPKSSDKRAKMDVTGMVLLGTGLLASMYATSYLGSAATSVWSPAFVGPLVVAITALCLFFRHNQRTAHPFIVPRLIYGPGFGTVNLINILYGGMTIGMLTLTPLYAINRYGMSALESGTLLVAQGAAAILFSVGATFALRRTGYRLPLYIGSGIIVIGMLLLAVKPINGLSPYAWLAAAAFLVGVGRGTINPASRNAGIQLALEHSSSIAALRSMCMQIGSIITIAITTAILTSSNDSGTIQARVYIATAVLLIIALPLIARIPEHHGSW